MVYESSYSLKEVKLQFKYVPKSNSISQKRLPFTRNTPFEVLKVNLALFSILFWVALYSLRTFFQIAWIFLTTQIIAVIFFFV